MFDMIIIFKDNSRMLIPNVSHYRWNESMGAVSVEIDGYRQFFNIDCIKCIGRVEDIGTFEKFHTHEIERR